MPGTATLNERLQELIGEVSDDYHALERSRRSLTEALKEMKHQWMRAVLIDDFSNYSDSGVFRRDPVEERAAWSDRHHRYNKWERVPLVGIMARSEIGPTGSVELTFIVPGDKAEYKIRAMYYTLEILDRTPVTDDSPASPLASKVTRRSWRTDSDTSTAG